MEVNENGEGQEECPTVKGQEECPTVPFDGSQQISEEAVKVAGEAIQGVCSNNSKVPPLGPGHRRSRSEVVNSVQRSNSFQRLKSSMQRALQWGSSSQKETFFNPEILANQKRQWYQFHSRTSDLTKFEEPSSLFEHFIIVGIHPDAKLELVEDAYAKRKNWELQAENSEMVDVRMTQNRGPLLPTLEPQVLFKYPPGKRVAMRLKDLSAFCFPGGVKARVLERTPSMSDLNQLVYGQEHINRDDLSFIFSVKAADNATLYGLCLHVHELIQRPPAITGAGSPLSRAFKGGSRFLVSAPRCYCLLTRVPFFELHYETLNSIIAQERLNRITQFVSEMTTTDYVSPESKLNDQMNANVDCSNQDCITEWMSSTMPADSAVALTAAAADVPSSDDKLRSPSLRWDPHSPSTSEDSNHSQARDVDKDRGKDLQNCDDCTSDASEKCSGTGRMYGSRDNNQIPEVEAYACPGSRTLERPGSFDSLLSSARSVGSEDEEDEIFSCSDKDAGAEMTLEWARNQNDLLQIVCSYHAMRIPLRGTKIVFRPLEHLQPIEYRRSPTLALEVREKHLHLEVQDSLNTAEVNLKLAAAEEAVALSVWTTTTVCRVLSLENVLRLVTGVLLEKQVVVVCPNLGILSATVLSLIPMIRPFEWQSLFLPVLPVKMFDFLDAPVPFVVGIQHKPADLKMKTSNLIQVNVEKDQVKLCSLPMLPRHKELLSELRPIHARLSQEKPICRRRPVYKCNSVQAEAASQYLTIMRRYLESLCTDLTSHTITSVQSNNDRVSILLKDSFVDSFPSKDQPFIKLFVDTQLFTVLSDSRLTRYENGYY